MKQNFVKTLFIAICAMAALPTFAYDCEVDGIYYNLFEYKIENESVFLAEVTYGKNDYSGTISIPASIDYSGKTYYVATIGVRAFSVCTNLTNVNIPNTVTMIRSSAFSGCTGLTKITIPSSVTSIENGVFAWCSGLEIIQVENGNQKYDSREGCNALIDTYHNSLIAGCKNSTIPNNVEAIGGEAFEGCTGLTSINIPNSVTEIGYDAFYACTGLTSINIPNSVTEIGYRAFHDCTGLTTITIPNSVTHIGDGAFSGCTGLTSINIPNGVTEINSSSFAYCTSLTSITIPNSVTEINSSSFYNCTSLTSISIPNSVKSIGYYAFEECTRLTSVTLNCNNIVSSKRDINNTISKYFGEQVEEYIIGDDVKSIGSYTFYGLKKLKTVKIGKGVTSIGEMAFSDAGITSLSLSEGLREVSYSAFVGCELGSVTIPSTVTTIEKEAFYCPTLKHVELNSNSLVSTNYTEDGSLDAFFGEKVEEYVLGPDVKSIGRYAFSGCTGLKTIVLSENMDRIRDNAFEGCDELEEIHILNPEPPIVLENSFSQDAYKYAVLYVPEGSQEVYKADEVWKKFSRVRTTDMAAKDCRLTLKGFNGGTVALQCRTKASYTFELKPEAGWIVSSIMFNGTDVTNEMSAGSYTTPSLTGDSELAIVFEQGNNGVRDAMVYSQIHISAYNAELNIRNDGNTTVQADVYTTDGRIVKRVSVSNGTTIIPLTNNKTYLVKVGSKTYKVAF